METSEKRKERLKAMRVEAEEAEACDNGSSAVPGYLSNPLAEDNAAVQEEPCAPCRFGYYTDPMAAFSLDTKRTKVADHIASNTGASPLARLPSPLSGMPRNPEMAPPSHQFQSNYSPDPRMYQQNFGPQRSPIGLARPFAMHHGNPPQVWNGAEGRFPGPRFRPPGGPGFRPPGSPGFGPPGTPGFGPPGSPGFGPPGSPGSGPPGSPAFGLPGSPAFVTNTWQGRGHRLSHSPSPHSVHGGSPGSSSGRGRGRPGSGWRGGRGRGSHGPASDRQLGPEQFYNASMVDENPWKGLPPVSWKGVDAISYGSSNRPSYGSTNRPAYGSTSKASFSEGSNKSTPVPNLAEYLAASCNETINEAPTPTS